MLYLTVVSKICTSLFLSFSSLERHTQGQKREREREKEREKEREREREREKRERRQKFHQYNDSLKKKKTKKNTAHTPISTRSQTFKHTHLNTPHYIHAQAHVFRPRITLKKLYTTCRLVDE